MKLVAKKKSRVADALNISVLFLIAVVSFLPFLHIISGAFTSPEEYLRKDFILIPSKLSLETLQFIFTTNTIPRGLAISLYITVVGTLINLCFTVSMAYARAHQNLFARRTIMFLIVFTILFNGGIIPTYLVVKAVGMMNTFWSLMVPRAISAFYLIILKNFFQQLPQSLEDSAKMDGANDLTILARIILPLSKPALATFAIFYAVAHWNAFFEAILYLNHPRQWPIQVILRQVVILAQGGVGELEDLDEAVARIPAESVKMATILIATLPILCVYPFLQKHFTKGILLGSVKG